VSSLRGVKNVKGRAAVIGLLAFLSIVPGEYYVRWISAVALAVFLGAVLIGEDVRIPYRRGASEVEYIRKRPDFERALNIVKRAKKGGARNLIEEELLEMLYVLTGRSFHELRANPPEALRVFYSSPNPYEGLKRALKVLEAEVDEDRGSSREV